MPELPEVETVRRGLNQLTLNRKITGGDVLLHRTIAYPFSIEEFVNRIRESSIVTWHRRGKYLLAELAQSPKKETSSSPSELGGVKGKGEGGKVLNPLPLAPSPSPHPAFLGSQTTSWLGVHLRMTGQLLWLHQDEPLHKHTRVRLFFEDQMELRFVDQRTFGQMWWVPPEVVVESIMTGLGKLAVDPFSAEFTVNYLVAKLQNRRRPIKTALLDQSVVAGLGNIYADEALFKSGILPETLCTDLQLKQIELLRTAIIKVLETSIEAGGTTFSNFLNVQGVNGNYGGVAWVYNRAGEPCRVCGTPIGRIKLAGRSSHFCFQCQH